MKKEIILPFSLLFTGLLVSFTSLYLDWFQRKNPVISPYSDSFSVFSMMRTTERPKYTVYGFLPYWTLDSIEYLQMDKLTDIAYFGLYLNADGTFQKSIEDGTAEPGYNNWKNNSKLSQLIRSAKTQGVRVSLTVISHNAESTDAFLNCEKCWKTFGNELIKELDAKGLKDVHLNFEYADYTDESYADKYTKLADFINKTLDAKYDDSYVVVSTFADSIVKPRVTKVQDLSKVVDALFIMAYDFHRPDSDQAGAVAPIGGAGKTSEYDINTMIKDYLAVMPPTKMILGVPYYGYNWVVNAPEPNSERIPGNDLIGYSQSQAYEYIMDTILEVKPKIEWDPLALTPYFTYTSPETGSTRQVYYEDEKSLQAKYDLAKQNSLAGVGIWALGYDGGYQELWKLLKNEFVQ